MTKKTPAQKRVDTMVRKYGKNWRVMLGKKSADTIKKRYGEDYYAQVGAIGGKGSSNGGFGSKKVGKDGLTGKERSVVAGVKGGRISRRRSNA